MLQFSGTHGYRSNRNTLMNEFPIVIVEVKNKTQFVWGSLISGHVWLRTTMSIRYNEENKQSII